jgi:hypothetical protein
MAASNFETYPSLLDPAGSSPQGSPGVGGLPSGSPTCENPNPAAGALGGVPIAGNLQLFGFSAALQPPLADSTTTAQNNDITFFGTSPTQLIGGGLNYDQYDGGASEYGLLVVPALEHLL